MLLGEWDQQDTMCTEIYVQNEQQHLSVPYSIHLHYRNLPRVRKGF